MDIWTENKQSAIVDVREEPQEEHHPHHRIPHPHRPRNLVNALPRRSAKTLRLHPVHLHTRVQFGVARHLLLGLLLRIGHEISSAAEYPRTVSDVRDLPIDGAGMLRFPLSHLHMSEPYGAHGLASA